MDKEEAKEFNHEAAKLTSAERERLTKLVEEAGEVIQVAAKILFWDHYDGLYKKYGKTKREVLECELGDFFFWLEEMFQHDDIDFDNVTENAKKKRKSAVKYTRYQDYSTDPEIFT